MSASTLVTERVDARSILNLPDHVRGSFPLRIVKGMLIPGSPAITTPGLRPGEAVQEEAITLSTEGADRLGEFVTRIVVNQEKIYRNCMTFAAYMAGGIALDGAKPNMSAYGGTLHEVNPEALTSGDAHVVFLADKRTVVHGLVGSNNPTENLGVWGDNNPLVIGSNTDMLETYEGAHIMRVSGSLLLQ